jgi:hypothetical protein
MKKGIRTPQAPTEKNDGDAQGEENWEEALFRYLLIWIFVSPVVAHLGENDAIMASPDASGGFRPKSAFLIRLLCIAPKEERGGSASLLAAGERRSSFARQIHRQISLTSRKCASHLRQHFVDHGEWAQIWSPNRIGIGWASPGQELEVRVAPGFNNIMKHTEISGQILDKLKNFGLRTDLNSVHNMKGDFARFHGGQMLMMMT